MFDIPSAVGKVSDFFGGVLDKFIPDAIEREKVSIELAQMAFKEAEMAYADRDSARKREMEVKDKVPAHLAYIAIGAFIMLAMYVTVWGVADNSRDIVFAILGWVTGFVGSAFGYYFGASSDKKGGTIK
jgi:hypothetical protein